MKKIIIFFIMLFMLVASPVEAISIQDRDNIVNAVNKLEETKEDKKKDDRAMDSSGSLAFWGMIAVAFLAISVFIIAYKFDDGLPDD